MDTKVVIKDNLKIIGKFTLVHEDGTEEEIDGKRSFCICGLSSTMPFCDNSHKSKALIKYHDGQEVVVNYLEVAKGDDVHVLVPNRKKPQRKLNDSVMAIIVNKKARWVIKEK